MSDSVPSDVRVWQVIEVVVSPQSDGNAVDRSRLHERLADLLNKRGLGPGDVLVPLPQERDIPSSGNGYRFHMLIFAPKRNAWSWQITT